jgi:hypothetical protein
MKMPKRFTETAKWEDDWFLGLSAMHKLLWFYLCDRCDHAGVWQVSQNAVNLFLGSPVDLSEALRTFGERIDASKPSYWRLTKFLEYQYGLPLNPSNKVHASALAILEKHGYSSPLQAPTKPLPSPMQGAKDKDKDKDKDSISKTLKPASGWEASPDFVRFWQAWPRSSRKGSPVEAYKAWVKATPPIDKVLETLAWKKKTEDWAVRPDGKDFIKMPSTWLNNSGWLEENPAAHKDNFKRMAPRQKPPEDDEPLPF